jgi:2-oxoacid:acceptor oxidoreductase gamma subunit (pyruvate/2-ketoisovalerate family)
MLEVRFHGRGGQGTVLAAKMLADVVLRSGKGECMAIPEFGVERRGAPVLAYARISDGPILLRTRIYEPDVVVVMDTAAAPPEKVSDGLKPGGKILVNSEHTPEELAKTWPGFDVIGMPARKIALSHGLGTPMAPVLNTAVIGAFCAAFEIAEMKDLEAVIRESVPIKIDENIAAAREAYALIAERRAHAATSV